MPHEKLPDNPESEAASPKAFGLTFAAVFVAIGVLPLFRHEPLRTWSLIVGVLFLGVALTEPGLLGPLNRAWSLVGSSLSRVMTPVLMALVFVCAIIPIALLRKVVGGTGLALRFDPKLKSYWISRADPAADPESLKRQF